MEKKEIEWMALKKGRAEGEAKGRAEDVQALAAYLKSQDNSLTMEQAMQKAYKILKVPQPSDSLSTQFYGYLRRQS